MLIVIGIVAAIILAIAGNLTASMVILGLCAAIVMLAAIVS